MRVLVIDDDVKVADLVARALREEGHEAATAHDGVSGERAALEGAWDLLVLDWMLPGRDGLSVCRALRGAGVQTPVLMLTARDEVSERVLGLDAGADDYITKPFALEELLARVRALGRRSGVGVTTLAAGPLVLELTRRVVRLADGAVVELTNREFALLEYLCRHAGRAVPRSELLAQVWSLPFDPGTNVVDVTIRHLREKLGDAGRHVTTTRGVGYAFER